MKYIEGTPEEIREFNSQESKQCGLEKQNPSPCRTDSLFNDGLSGDKTPDTSSTNRVKDDLWDLQVKGIIDHEERSIIVKKINKYEDKLKQENKSKLKTMYETYGEPDSRLGKHLCCPDCGACLTCGDCICEKQENKSKLRFPETKTGDYSDVVEDYRKKQENKSKGCGKYIKKDDRSCGDKYGYYNNEKRPYVNKKSEYNIWLCDECRPQDKYERLNDKTKGLNSSVS